MCPWDCSLTWSLPSCFFFLFLMNLPVPDEVSSTPLHSHCWCDLPSMCMWPSEHGPRQKNKPLLQPHDTYLWSPGVTGLADTHTKPCSKLLRYGLSMPFLSPHLSHCPLLILSVDVTFIAPQESSGSLSPRDI